LGLPKPSVTHWVQQVHRTERTMSQVTTPTEPGWLPDPSGRYEWRYWDGGWTNRVANSSPAPSAPAPSPAPAPANSWPAPAAPAPSPAPAPAAPATAPAPATARDAVPRVPFGTDPPATPETPPAVRRRVRRTPWVVLVDFFRSFATEEESYHNALAREPLPTDPRGERMVNAPGNYGYATIVALAGCAIVIGAYLPWISGTIGLAAFHRSGFDDGLGVGYSIGAIALAISALLSVRMRVFRWLTIILSFVIAGFVVRDVLHTYDAIQEWNRSTTVNANLGWGLWIMIVAAAIGMIGSVRLSESEKIG
jgi:hypothetical protein